MDLSATLAMAGIILALLWFGRKKSQRLPPGPFALPLIGNLPQLEKEAPFKSFIEVSSVGAFMFMIHDLGPLPAQGSLTHMFLLLFHGTILTAFSYEWSRFHTFLYIVMITYQSIFFQH